MAQFNPNMSKEELVNQFSSKSPFLNKMSTESAYRYIVNRYPQYKLESEDKIYEPAAEKETNIWDSLPSFIRKGYNDSLQGMAYEISTGQKRFDISDYEEGIINDLGAGIASFFAPLDFAVTAFGGGLGGVLAKTAGKETVKKYVFKKLVQNGVNRKMAAKSANNAVEFVTKSGSGAGALGLYSGVGDALQQKITDGTIDVDRVVKTGVKGAVLGGMTSGTGAYLTQRGAKTLTKVSAEIGMFGIGAPALEGELPTPQDFLHAGSMVIGMKGVGAVTSKGYGKLQEFVKDARKPEFRYEHIPEGVTGRSQVYQASAEASAISMLGRKKSEQLWTDKSGKRKGTVVSEDDKTVQFKPFEGESRSYSKKYFYGNFKSTEQQKLNATQLQDARNKDIRALEKELKYSSKVKQTKRAIGIDKSSSKKKINLKNMNNVSKMKYLDDLLLEKYTLESLKNMDKVGIRVIKPRVSLFMDKLLPEKINKLFDIVRPAKNQGSVDQVRRAYIGIADKYLSSNRRVVAESHDLMSKAGLLSKKPSREQVKSLASALNMSERDVSKRYWELLSDAVEQGIETNDTIAYKSITDYLFNTARQSGVDVSGYIDRYIPRILKSDVAEAIFEDIDNLAEIAFKGAKIPKGKGAKENLNNYQKIIDSLLEAKENPDKWASIEANKSTANFLNKIIEQSMNKFKSEYTVRGIKSFVEEGGELAHFKAMTKLLRETHGDLFRLDGNLEKRRKATLPTEFYERDARNLLGIYSSNVARRSAEVKHFGREGELATALMNNATRDDRLIMKELHHHILGDIAYRREYNLNPSIKNFLQKAMEFETTTKIGLGTASAMNLSQFTISSALSAGYWRFAKGSYKYYTDKDFRRQVDASGADLYKYVNEMMGISQQDNLSKKIVGKVTELSGFNAINSINNRLAAATARVFIDDLLAITSGKRNVLNPGQLGSKKWARATLAKMGIEPGDIKNGKVSESVMLDVISKFAINTQLQQNILSDPLVLNRPSWKPFLQFKSFGYRQYNFIKDTLTHDALNYNVFPMLRLASAGFATGAIALKAKEYMKYLVSGEKDYDPSKFLEADGEEIIENIAAIGAFGFLGDFMMSALEEGRSTARAIQFLATPAFMSDIDMFLNSFLPALERDYKNYRGDFIKRVPARALKLTGSPLLKELAKQVETTGMKKERIEFLRGRRKSALLDKIIKSETPEAYAEAIEFMNRWNSIYRNYPILITDIDHKAVFKRKMQKWEKRGEV
tara:strand:+ start:11559 stop:15302 length:3744 start_codon:yes stop_codon:yes gene_type:complete